MTPRPAAGFTLLELLVALAVLGLLLAGLGQGMRSGLLSWERAGQAIAAGTTLDGVDRTLRRLVAQMHPGTTRQPARIAAGPASLGFVTTLPGPEPRPVEAVLLVDATRRLVLRWRPAGRAGQPAPPAFQDAELLRDVRGFALAYWQPEAGWSARWDGPGLPPLIRIRLGEASAGRARWPDIIVAPGLDPP